ALPLEQTTDPTLFTGWLRLLDLSDLLSRVRTGSPSIYEILDFAGGPQPSLDAYKDALSRRSGWSREDLDFLAGSLGLVFPDDYKDERALVRLAACFDLLQRLGVSAEQADAWKNPADLDQAPACALAIRQAVKAKYDDATWLRVAQPLRDGLRQRQ